MTMVYLETSAIAVVTGVSQCAYDALDDKPDRFCAIVPGDIAWDECECGQLAASIDQIGSGTTAGVISPDTQQIRCGAPYIVMNVTLTMVRCVPVSSDSGRPPKCSALVAAAIRLEQDRYQIRQAVVCCLRNLYDANSIASFAVGAAATIGPQGACAGFNLPYTVSFINTGCC